jgi:hypothetical protein
MEGKFDPPLSDADASAAKSVFVYTATRYCGNLTGPPPSGLTAMPGRVFVCNLNEVKLPIGQFPTRPGDWSWGFISGQFTDPDSGDTLTPVEVDHPARGAC